MRTPPASALVVPAGLLVDGLTALAVARTEREVAEACLPPLLSLPGVRAAAVAQRHGRAAVLLASAGYDCGSMGPGTALPLDSGLPVTECVRTGRPVVRGAGPSWVALPLAGSTARGALLLSLTAAPPDGEDTAVLQRLAEALGATLRRAAGQDGDVALLGALRAGLQGSSLSAARGSGHGPAPATAVRVLPAAGDVGGDVLACLPDGAGGWWLVAADVCGSGVPAALVAAGVRTALRACASTTDEPVRLLRAVDAAVRPDVGPDAFVTALAVHLPAGSRTLRVASAGHPGPLLLGDRRPREVPVEPGPPLALAGQPPPDLAPLAVELPVGAAVLLHTDGLVERRVDGHVLQLDARALVPADTSDLERTADAVVAAAAAAGPATDDVGVLLARPRHVASEP